MANLYSSEYEWHQSAHVYVGKSPDNIEQTSGCRKIMCSIKILNKRNSVLFTEIVSVNPDVSASLFTK